MHITCMVNKMPQVPEYPYPRMHALAIRHFLDCLAEGREPITPASYGVRIMTILDAIYALALAQSPGIVPKSAWKGTDLSTRAVAEADPLCRERQLAYLEQPL